MRINARYHLSQLAPYLDNIRKAQVPYALSQTMNKIGFEVAKNVWPEVMKREISGGPTSFTKNAGRYLKGSKKDPTTTIYFEKIREQYLMPALFGGPVIGGPKSKGYEAVPIKVRLNQYGNIGGLKSGRLKRLLKQPNHFRATIRGIDGIWKRLKRTRRRPKGGVELVVLFSSNYTYKGFLKIPLERAALQFVQTRSQAIFAREVKNAVKKDPFRAKKAAQRMGLL